MSRSSKILIGILSFLPILLLIGLFGSMFFQFTHIMRWEEQEPEAREVFSVFGPFFIIGMLLFIFSIGLLIFFIIQLVRNKKMEGTERAIWILAFLLGGIISYPIFWYMKIWRDDL